MRKTTILKQYLPLLLLFDLFLAFLDFDLDSETEPDLDSNLEESWFPKGDLVSFPPLILLKKKKIKNKLFSKKKFIQIFSKICKF